MAEIKATSKSRHQRIPQKAIDAMVQHVVQQFKPEKVILFGSYAYGAPKPESDVDLLVVMNTSLKEVEQAIQIRQSIRSRMALDLLVHTPEKLAQRLKLGDFFLREITQQGKVLYERAHAWVGGKG